ncbi:hypothetical protein BGZ49_006928 [Haplosporangium sp. Z 27]|nr:hypothetical protein BGZ49_006928 [Haplosporangium sp. Z 27]
MLGSQVNTEDVETADQQQETISSTANTIDASTSTLIKKCEALEEDTGGIPKDKSKICLLRKLIAIYLCQN